MTRAGGRGYILKDADPETMLRAIRAVAARESLLGPTIAQKVIRQFAGMDKVQLRTNYLLKASRQVDKGPARLPGHLEFGGD